jgi:hydroxyacid-oxoacid transhydrogenase
VKRTRDVRPGYAARAVAFGRVASGLGMTARARLHEPGIGRIAIERRTDPVVRAAPDLVKGVRIAARGDALVQREGTGRVTFDTDAPLQGDREVETGFVTSSLGRARPQIGGSSIVARHADPVVEPGTEFVHRVRMFERDGFLEKRHDSHHVALSIGGGELLRSLVENVRLRVHASPFGSHETSSAAFTPHFCAAARAAGTFQRSLEERGSPRGRRRYTSMICCQGYDFVAGGDTTFEVDASRIKYGSGALREVGFDAKDLGMTRVALFTDPQLAASAFVATVRESLEAAGIDVAVYDESRVEPTDASFRAAAAFATEGRFDGFVSVGGGSSIDTAKAANLYSRYPDDFDAYVNAPIGRAKPIPGPLRPHIACPTTCGTGAEVTGIAIFDYLAYRAKTGIASKRLKPTLGIVDPDVTMTLPSTVVACSGFDVLSHALESYTARPYTARMRPATPGTRPMSQGANPFSDIASREAMRILGANIVRAVSDPHDAEARERMIFAAMLAGIGFGNAGVHVPHAMSYAVAGLVRAYRAPEYPAFEAIVPHGMAVIVSAPASTRFSARANPERHLEAAELLGADVRDATEADAGDVLARRIEELMRATGMPNGIGGVGFTRADIPSLRDGASPQKRLLANAPSPVGDAELEALFTSALSYW